MDGCADEWTRPVININLCKILAMHMQMQMKLCPTDMFPFFCLGKTFAGDLLIIRERG